MIRSLVILCLIIDVGQSADPPDPASATPRSFANRDEAQRHWKAEREADLKAFRTVFEEGQSLSVRDRLERAATVTGEIAALAEKITDKKIAEQMATVYPTRIAVYPRTSHLIRLLGVRPWIRDEVRHHHHRLALLCTASSDLRWPTEKEQPELRRLLGDREPDIRAMAIEAIATLHDPADLKLIAKVSFWVGAPPPFSDGKPPSSIPRLGAQRPVWGNGWPGEGSFIQTGDPLIFDLYWRSATVPEYIDQGLQQLTGANVTRTTLDAWVSKYGDTRDSLWYWQRYLQYRFNELDDSVTRATDSHFWSEEWSRLRAANASLLRTTLLAELAKLDRLVEAKVLLLTTHLFDDCDLDESPQRFFDPPWQTRLNKDELFMLLEGKRLWNDVPWNNEVDWTTNGEGRFHRFDERLATRIMLNAEKSFTVEDVPRLQKLLDNPRLKIGPSGYAAWFIGISRLLPSAAADNLDDPQTRDGYLRNVVRTEPDCAMRNYVIAELVRVGLPNDATFLRDVFFATNDKRSVPPKCATILQALGKAPLTKEKRALLVELVSDERCRSILVPPERNGGDDAPRNAAAKSINAHAHSSLINYHDINDLSQQTKSEAALDRIIVKLKQLEASP